MPTIDSIKIALGVDASQIAKDVQAANSQLDKIAKNRQAWVTLSVRADASLNKAGGVLDKLADRIKKLGDIELGIKVKPEDIRVGEVRKSVAEALAADGGIPLPVKLKELTKAEASATRDAIRAAVGAVILDWEFAAKPKGGPPTGGGSSGPDPTPPSSPGAGPTGSGPKPRGGKPSGGATATPPASPSPGPSGRTERQRDIDEQLKTEYKTRKRIEDEPENTPRQKTKKARLLKEHNEEIERLRKAQREEAKRTREERRQRAVPVPPPPPTPDDRDLSLAGTGGKTKPRPQKATPPVPKGKPGTGIATSLDIVPPAEDPFRQLAAGDRGKFVGKGKENNFRGGSAPRDPLGRAEDLVPGFGKFVQPRGTVPTTINPQMAAHIETLKQKGYGDELVAWAKDMREKGFNPQTVFTDKEARREYKRSLPNDKARRKFGKAVGRAIEGLSTSDIGVLNMVLGYANASGHRFAAAAEHSKGGIVNLTGEDLGGRMVANAIKPTPLPETAADIRAKAIPDLPPGSIKSGSGSRRGVTPLSLVDPAAGAALLNTALPPMSPGYVAPGKPPLTLGDLTANFGVHPFPEPGTTTPSSYATAYGRMAEKRYAKLRKAGGLPPLTTEERIRASQRFKFSGLDPVGGRRLTIPGFAEGGALADGGFYGRTTSLGKLPPAPEGYERVFRGGRPWRSPEERPWILSSSKHGAYGEGVYTTPDYDTAEQYSREDWRKDLPLLDDRWQGVIQSGLVAKRRILDLPRPWEDEAAAGSDADVFLSLARAGLLAPADAPPRGFPWDIPAKARGKTLDELKTSLPDHDWPGWLQDDLARPALSKLGYGALRYEASTDRHPFPPQHVLVKNPRDIFPEFADVRDDRADRAEGGTVRHTGLASSKAPMSVTMVGERGKELIVQGANGEAEVIPNHKVESWLTGHRGGHHERAAGGLFPGSFPMRGVRGSVGASALSKGTISAADILRVYVVNWPTSLHGGVAVAGGGAPVGRPQAGAAAQPIKGPAGAPGVAGIVGATGAIPRMGSSFLPRSEVAALGIASRFGDRDRRKELREASARVSVALAENPVRAFAVGLAQVIATKTGRGELIERAKGAQLNIEMANEERTRAAAQRFRVESFKAEAKGLDMTDKAQAKRAKALAAVIPDEEQAATLLEDNAESMRKFAVESSHGLTSGKAQIANLGIGLVSVIGGGLALRALFTTVSQIFEVGAQSIGNFVERASGYKNATAEMTKATAEATRANSGNAQSVVAGQFAQSGLATRTANAIGPLLERRAQTIAGNQGLEEQLRQVSAGRNIMDENRRTGLPAGFDRNLVQSVGGLFDTGFGPGALRSTQELAAEKLNDRGNNYDFLGQAKDLPRFLGDVVGVAGDQLRGDQAAANKRAAAISADLQDPAAEAAKRLADNLGDINAQLEKADSPFEILANADPAAVKATVDAFNAIGATDLAKAAEARGVAVQVGGRTITDRAGASGFLADLDRSGTRADPRQLIAQLTGRPEGGLGPLDVQLRDIARRGTFQRQALRASTALSFAANPLVPISEPRLRPSGGIPGVPDAANVGQQYQTAFAKYSSAASSAQDYVNQRVEEGRQLLEKWVPPSLVGDITSLGKSIQGIRLDLGQKSLNIEVAQYNNQLRIARRSLQDARDLQNGIKGATKDTLGGLQGQNVAMQRQLQLLGFELQQRQINLQLAVAGFQVPGETPEERAGRQQAAIAEAGFAQKQLDLQEKLASNDFSANIIEVARSVTDLGADITLLTESKAFAIDTYAANIALDSMTAELDQLQQEAQTYFDQGTKQADLLLGAITDIESRSSEVFSKWGDDLVDAYEKAGKAAGAAATDFVIASIEESLILGSGGATAESGGGGGGGRRWFKASGALFDTNGQTDMTVGEAGTETVAVLRNPRRMFADLAGSSSTGSSGAITVNINNPTVREPADIDRLAHQVQEALNRSVRLMGLQ